MANYLGARVRQIRKEKGETVKSLAEKTGLSSSLISQVERGKANPSVKTLWNIATTLKVPIGSFFEPLHKNSPVVRKKDRKSISVKDGVKFYLLSPDLKRKLELMYDVFEPSACTQLYSHEGEECGLVLKGKIEVTLGNKKYILEEGDSISFSSTTPHKLRNIGKEKAILVWVNTPPSF